MKKSLFKKNQYIFDAISKIISKTTFKFYETSEYTSNNIINNMKIKFLKIKYLYIV